MIVAPRAPVYVRLIGLMNKSQRHRGPDGSGMHVFSKCALGHVRLSIVDHDGGAQPMLSTDENVAVTFNGEIYGYQALRRKLRYPFKTLSDTEVILALYEEYAEHMCSHLPGMFAFAVWDDRTDTLFCARDRLGEKPLYYALGRNGEFICASELKAIVNTGLVDLSLDSHALAHYLQKLYIPVGRSIYENIYALPPGHSLTFKDESVVLRRYWSLSSDHESLSMSDAIEGFQFHLERAVDQQLVADVEVAAFLSGGLDSTTIVHLARKKAPSLRCISFGFTDVDNELPYAREVVKTYGLPHIEVMDSSQNIAELLVRMATVYDEPFGDPSSIPTYLISQVASKHVKVVLAGDGGDELLGGYQWYRPLLRKQCDKDVRCYMILFYLIKIARRLRAPLPRWSRDYVHGAARLNRCHDLRRAHWHLNEFFTQEDVSSLGLTPMAPPVDVSSSYTVDAALRSDQSDYLPGDILTKTDRASMANGLEIRSPFLDQDLVEFCNTLPLSLKINRESDKIMLRMAYEHSWPITIRNRPKRGFGAPVSKWLNRADMKELAQAYLHGSNLRIFNVCDAKAIERFVRRNNIHKWLLLVLSVWLETHTAE